MTLSGQFSIIFRQFSLWRYEQYFYLFLKFWETCELTLFSSPAGVHTHCSTSCCIPGVLPTAVGHCHQSSLGISSTVWLLLQDIETHCHISNQHLPADTDFVFVKQSLPLAGNGIFPCCFSLQIFKLQDTTPVPPIADHLPVLMHSATMQWSNPRYSMFLWFCDAQTSVKGCRIHSGAAWLEHGHPALNWGDSVTPGAWLFDHTREQERCL